MMLWVIMGNEVKWHLSGRASANRREVNIGDMGKKEKVHIMG